MSTMTTTQAYALLRTGLANFNKPYEPNSQNAKIAGLFDTVNMKGNGGAYLHQQFTPLGEANAFEGITELEEHPTDEMIFTWMLEVKPRMVTHAFAISEMVDWLKDGRIDFDIVQTSMTSLQNSMDAMRNTLATNIFNNSQSASHLWGDGKPLIATDHPDAIGGTNQNRPTVAVPLSEAGIKTVLNLMKKAVDDRGVPIGITPGAMIVPNELYFDAVVLTRSKGRLSSNNSAVVNPIEALSLINEPLIELSLLTNPNTFYWRTNVKGLGFFDWGGKTIEDPNELRGSTIYAQKRLYNFAAIDWRAVFSGGLT